MIIEYHEIIKLYNKLVRPNQTSKFKKKNLVKINNDSREK